MDFMFMKIVLQQIKLENFYLYGVFLDDKYIDTPNYYLQNEDSNQNSLIFGSDIGKFRILGKSSFINIWLSDKEYINYNA